MRAVERPVDAQALTGFATQLENQPGIEALDVRQSTGSLVVEHPALVAEQLEECVLRAGGQLEDQTVRPAAPRDTLAPVRQTVGGIDSVLGQLTAGGVDMRTLAFITMFSLGIAQLLRGQVMMPAFSFLWYAFELAKRSPDSPEPPSSGGQAGVT